MAGTDPRFDATQFRDAIKFAMQMGFPDEESKQLTWTWKTQQSYRKQDSGGRPFEFVASQVTAEIVVEPMIVDCAVKYAAANTGVRVGGTSEGPMDLAGVTATLLDVDFEALRSHGSGAFPDGASIDGIAYEVQFINPPYGLFEVTVYDVVLQATDEA